MNRDVLIEIMLDESAYEEERADAVGYLSDFSDLISLDALVVVANNPHETSYVKGKAGESIALIMISRGILDEKYFNDISEEAKNEILAVFMDDKNDWYKQLIGK